MIKQKVYLPPEKLDQLSNLNIGFGPAFQLIVLIKTGFSICNTFTLSGDDEVAART